MSCSKIQKLLSLYQDNELDADRHEMVKSHLEQCPVCRQEAEELNVLSAAVKTFKPIQAPPRFEDIVMQRVMVLPPPAVPTWFERFFVSHQRRWTLAMATPALALLILSLVLPSIPRHSTETPNSLVASSGLPNAQSGDDAHPVTTASTDSDTFYATPVLIGEDDRADRLLSAPSRGFQTVSRTGPLYRDPLLQVRSVREELVPSDWRHSGHEFPVIYSNFQQEKQTICPSCYETLDVLSFYPSAKIEPRTFKVVASYR